MKRRRLVTAFAVGLCSLALTVGCSSDNTGSDSGTTADSTGSNAASGTVRIGVTFPILDQFLQTVADAMQEEADAKGVELTIVAAQEKTDTQLGQVENFISQKMDAIIVVPVDTDAADPMTEAVTKANIPLVYVNRRPANLPEGVPYVGSDSYVAGTLEMQALADLVDHKGNVVILQGDPANEAAVQRTKGCKDIVAEYPDMKVTKEQAGNWYREEGLSIMENWLQSGDDIAVVCSNNDEMALGAIEAIKAAGKLDQIVVGGVDATSDALDAMAAGELEVSVFQDAAGQGGGSIDAALTLLDGGTIPDDYVDIPYQLVTPDNMADFTK